MLDANSFGLKEEMDGLKTIGENTAALVKQYNETQKALNEKLFSAYLSQSLQSDMQKHMRSLILEPISIQKEVLTGALKALEEQSSLMKRILSNSIA